MGGASGAGFLVREWRSGGVGGGELGAVDVLLPGARAVGSAAVAGVLMRGARQFGTVQGLANALAAGTIPRVLVSPGAAASMLGVQRARVLQLVRGGVLRAFQGGRVLLVEAASVVDEAERRRSSGACSC